MKRAKPQAKKKAKKKQVKPAATQKKKAKTKSKTTVKKEATPRKRRKSAPKKKKGKRVLPTPLHILAVAIGDPANTRPIIDNNTLTNLPVRPYISGMVEFLTAQGTVLGTNYVIDYQECFEGEEDFTVPPNPALILCMSTPLMVAAVAFTNQIPIVGVTSDPAQFAGNQNVYGVNAHRSKNAIPYFNHFSHDLGAGRTITLLNRRGSVGDICVDDIHRAHPGLPVATVDPLPGTDPRPAIVAAINGVNTDGLLVLPVDLFFGFSLTINTTAANQGLAVFWPAEEFAQGGQSHFGSSQIECGQAFGEQVQAVLNNQAPPRRWIPVQPR